MTPIRTDLGRFRADPHEVLDAVILSGRPVELTSDLATVAVLLPPAEYARLQRAAEVARAIDTSIDGPA